jgi:hypothetical protein
VKFTEEQQERADAFVAALELVGFNDRFSWMGDVIMLAEYIRTGRAPTTTGYDDDGEDGETEDSASWSPSLAWSPGIHEFELPPEPLTISDPVVGESPTEHP